MKDALKVGIIGMGKMGEALAQGLIKNPPFKKTEVLGSCRSIESAQETAARLGISVSQSNREVAKNSDVIVLCVKPHQAHEVLAEISEELIRGKTLVSVCAAVTTTELLAWSGGKASVVRAMPNTPALIGEGMTVLCAHSGDPQPLALAQRIFDSVGETCILEESLFDGVTGLSGCGPAYAYLVIEALSEAGVKVGIPRKTATLLAAQTLLGAAQMVLSRTDAHPAALKDEVTTPAGCTIDGLMALEEGKLRVTLIKAVLAAAHRSRNLKKS